jgi:group I intron endonuclease
MNYQHKYVCQLISHVLIMNNYVIYKHTSPSGKSYIGQTNNYNKRCSAHRRTSSCRGFSFAIKKYGWDNFQHEILMEGLSLEEANHWEPVLIADHNTLVPNGYNLMTGGMNSSHSADTRSKISESKRGTTHSDESRAKMSEANKGRILSSETKHLMSMSKRGRKMPPDVVERTNKNPEKIRKTAEAHRGMKRSEEAKRNMSIARKKILLEQGGPYNAGFKTYHNPNNIQEVVRCAPVDCPLGWVAGDPSKRGKRLYINTKTQIKKWWIPDQVDGDDWVEWNNRRDGRLSVCS